MFIGKTDAEAPILWLPDAKSQLMEKTMMLGKTEVRRRRGRQRMRRLDDIIDSMDMSLSKLWEIAKDRGAWRAAIHGLGRSPGGYPLQYSGLENSTYCKVQKVGHD